MRNKETRNPRLSMYRQRNLLLICLFIFYFLDSNAQQLNIKFTHLTNLDGLSQSTVQAIVKDKYGFMWFGTQDGLNRYDGYTFKVYRHQPKDSNSLRRSNIMSLYEDRQGTLWVGTTNGSLSMYDRKRDAFINFRESDGNYQGISQKSVTAMYEDRQNNFWVGTYWKLNLLDRKTGKTIQFGKNPADTASLSNDGITSIFEDSKNNLWIGTTAGLNLMDRKTKKFKHYLHDSNRSNSISNNYITVIKEDNSGLLWIGTNDGLNLFDPVSETFVHFKNDPDNPASITENRITAIEDGDNGKLWIGTGTALEFFDVAKRNFIHFANKPDEPTSLLRNGSVMSILLDNAGILWVGTYQGGINRYDKYLTYFDIYRNNPSDNLSLSFNTVTSFAENREGDIWISTGGGALNLWKKSVNQFIRYNPDPSDKNSLSSWGILCLYQSKKNDYLWIGTYGSCVDRFDVKKNTFKHFTKGDGISQLNNDAVYAIFEDSKGNIWMGTNGGGANVLNPATGVIAKYVQDPNNSNTITGNFVRCFYEDKKGNIWIGTTAGLSSFNPVSGNFTKYDQTNTELESDLIFSLYEDSNGNIWIGTLGGGLNLLDPHTKNVTIYTVNEGLPDNTINSIIEDDKGYLWLSTNNGISRFDPVKKTFKNNSLYNGIQSFEFSQGAGIKTSKGEILFGGINGFNAFYPKYLVENRNIPPIVITKFKLFNKTVAVDEKNSPLEQNISLTKELALSHNQSIITFEFAALGFTASEQNQYAFMLEGFDKKWNIGYQRTATYTNLDPGVYTFKVKASNNDGLWNEEATTIKIIISPPYWKTWWFRLFALLSITGGAIAFFQDRMKNIKTQQTKLKRLVDEQTRQLIQSAEEEHKARRQAEEFNKKLERKNTELEQFAYIASHDMQEPLRTTSNFVELLQKRYKGKLDEKADGYFTFILQSTERMRVLIKDLLDYSRIGREKQWELVDCNVILQETFADLTIVIKETHAEFECSPLPVINVYPTEIKQLFQNLIINAIKFRKKDVNPQIEISAKNINGYYEFTVADNGIGIDKKYNEKIFVIFQRLHNRVEYNGSGIGLAHCKKIVEMHGGKIWVESVPGKGTAFHFTIPKNNN